MISVLSFIEPAILDAGTRLEAWLSILRCTIAPQLQPQSLASLTLLQMTTSLMWLQMTTLASMLLIGPPTQETQPSYLLIIRHVEHIIEYDTEDMHDMTYMT